MAAGSSDVIRIDGDGMYVADPSRLTAEQLLLADSVCPFSDRALNEDQIAELVHESDLEGHGFLGRYRNTYAGRVADDQYLLDSSSGGMTSWLLTQLLKQGVVDAVLNVGRQDPATGPLFAYESSDREQVVLRRKSDYYSVTLDGALELVRTEDKKFALVGVPCFIKAARLLAKQDAVLNDRLEIFVGLVCGHMKSQFFGESLAWQLGVEPSELEAVDFRVKAPGRPSSDYDFAALRKGETEWVKGPTKSLLGGNWGYAAFQPEACNFCDDIFAEGADIAFGDAWLPGYTDDWRGTNVVVTRSSLLDGIVRAGFESGALSGGPIEPRLAEQSQAGNFRHRRLGVSVRLADDIAQGLSVPVKRVEPSLDVVDKRRLKVIRKRRELSRLSFSAYRKARETGDLSIYLDAMGKGIREYQRLARPLWKRVGSRVRGLARRLIRRG